MTDFFGAPEPGLKKVVADHICSSFSLAVHWNTRKFSIIYIMKKIYSRPECEFLEAPAKVQCSSELVTTEDFSQTDDFVW